MKTLFKLNCWLYDRLLSLHDDGLLFRHADEMRFLFRKQLSHAMKHGIRALAIVWKDVACETLTLVGPTYLRRLRLLSVSTLAASTLVACFLLGFCSFGNILVVHGSTAAEPISIASPDQLETTSLVSIANGHKMFLECSGDPHGKPTVILATGAGLGSYQAWTHVQSQADAFARVCSFDPLGAGKSDHVPGPHPIASVVDNMHQLFHAAPLPPPYILVGASAGGVLIRHYEERYPSEVAGFVFVDSSHEEMEWRDAAISKSFDPDWNNPAVLQANGMLLPQQKLTWHDDVPLIVLERTDLPPCSAFPTLSPSQCNQINQAWHSFQVDLASRSKYGQLRPIANSGHAMHLQQPQAIANAIHDVLAELPPKS